MKKTLSLLLMLILGISVSTARVPKSKIVVQVFKTDIRCENCKKKIMDNAAVFGAGVKDIKVNVASKEVTITYDTRKTSAEKLVKAFEQLKIKATPDRFVEGGAPQPAAAETPASSCCGGKSTCQPRTATEAR